MKKSIYLVFSVFLLLISCSKTEDELKVTYNVSCTDCMVVYTSDTAETQTTEYHQTTGWSYTFNARHGQEILFLAYNTHTQPELLTAQVFLNDVLIAADTAYCPISGYAFIVESIP